MPDKTSNKPSHLKDLALLFAIPIGIAVFAAIIVYGPRLFAHPAYDFIYSVCTSYGCGSDFTVDSSGHVSQNSSSDDPNRTAILRYYSAETDSTRSLSLEEAKRYRLNTSSKSPDGYALTKEDNGGRFLFVGNSEAGWYLKDGPKKKPVVLSNDTSYYSKDVTFLGWVMQ